jgi:protein involved in polysaccharide export with SLBB domain
MRRFFWILVLGAAGALMAQTNGPIPVAALPDAPLVYAGCNARTKAEWQRHLTLGPNDGVSFSIYGRPELARPDITIEPDGRVSYLEAVGMMAQGLTIEELRNLTTSILSKYYKNPRVMVAPAAWRSKRFHVLGKVVNKGTFPLDRPLTVIEGVGTAGGLETGLFQQNTVELADLPRSFLMRKGKRVPVDFDALFLRGDLRQNILLEPEDYMYFPSAIANEIYILGSVANPGQQGLTYKASVVSAIALAGGFTQRAYRERVLVVRGSLQNPQTFVVDTAAILHGKAIDFVLEPRDVVFVSERPWARAEELLDMAASSFIQAMATVWTGENIGPLITRPVLPSVR